MTTDKKFVILRGIEKGNRFFTTNVPGIDPTKLKDGTVAYTVDSVEEAQVFLFGRVYKG